MSGLLTDPWRAVCPEGHVNWATRGDGYYCRQCRERFDELRDKKAGRPGA